MIEVVKTMAVHLTSEVDIPGGESRIKISKKSGICCKLQCLAFAFYAKTVAEKYLQMLQLESADSDFFFKLHEFKLLKHPVYCKDLTGG